MFGLNCRAELYRQENDATMAIVNYSQVPMIIRRSLNFVRMSWLILIPHAIHSNFVVIFFFFSGD